ncbi:MAG: CehA/McbA family metallohydrolase, partial [Nocardioidaceae bacterium]
MRDADRHSRRDLLRLAGAGALTGVAATGAPLALPARAAATARTITLVRTGRFEPVGAPDWHYVPVDVPQGASAIAVSYSVASQGSPPGNVLDIGIFDSSGHDLGNAAGFRGYSGGARSRFTITASHATPGYLAGPVEPGRWHVLLGPYTVAPEGMDWRVEVTLTLGDRPGPDFVAAPAQTAVPGTGPGWYRADLHLHSVHSDGLRTLPELAAAAQRAGLDLIASTEHNTSSAGLVWGHHAPPDLLVLNGEEVTTRTGHWLALGTPAGTFVDWRYRAAEGHLGRFADQVRGLGGLVVAAHPFAPFKGTRWEFGYDDVDAVEVWNGPWTLDDQAAVEQWHGRLVAGRRTPVVGSSDSHREDQPVGTAQTVVRLERLERAEVVRALGAGRSYLAESLRVAVGFTVSDGVDTVGCGETLHTDPTGVVQANLEVHGAPGCIAQVLGPAGPIAAGKVDPTGRATVSGTAPAATTPFLRVEVRRPAPTDTT